MSTEEGDPRSRLRETVRSAVDNTNRKLAEVQASTEQMRAPLTKSLQQGQQFSKEAWRVFENRREYGPHLTAGAAVLFGAVGLRGGRLRGAAAGLAAGGLTYLVTCGPIEIHRAIDNVIHGRYSS